MLGIVDEQYFSMHSTGMNTTNKNILGSNAEKIKK